MLQAGYDVRTIIIPTSHPVLFQRMLTEIMVPQPQWTHRVHSICAFRVVRGNKKRSYALRLQVRLATNRWMTVSWRASILSEFPTAKLQACPIRIALRQCIRRQICTFRSYAKAQSRDGVLSCGICHDEDRATVYHVDHEEPTFATLVLTFLTETKNATDCPSAANIRYGRNGRRTFPSGCERFVRRWCLFHRKHAVLRILCCSCNLHRKR